MRAEITIFLIGLSPLFAGASQGVEKNYLCMPAVTDGESVTVAVAVVVIHTSNQLPLVLLLVRLLPNDYHYFKKYPSDLCRTNDILLP